MVTIFMYNFSAPCGWVECVFYASRQYYQQSPESLHAPGLTLDPWRRRISSSSGEVAWRRRERPRRGPGAWRRRWV